MAYEEVTQKPTKIKTYIIFNSYNGETVYTTTNKKEAEKYLSYHRFRGNTSLRITERDSFI